MGYLRGRYTNPLFALRLGYTAVRNGLRDQLIATKQEGLENIGIFSFPANTDIRRDPLLDERDWDSV